MLNRWSLLTLVLGLLAGYSLTGTSAQAQSEALPFAVGDTVTLWFGKDAAPPTMGSSVRCAVAAVRGAYVRCGRPNRIGERSDESERWIPMKYVTLVVKQDE